MSFAPKPGEPSPLSREALEELARIDTEIARRRGGRPLDYIYKPNSAQRKIHESKAKITACFAANRAGKSTAGMAEVTWRCTGNHPYKVTHTPPVHAWWVVPSFSAWEEVYVRSGLWAQWAPRDNTIHIRHHPQLVLEFTNGSTCTVMTQEMGLGKFAGAAPHFIYIDEKCDEGIWGECVVRIVTSRGQVLYTVTLIEGIGWEYEALWLPGTSGKDPDLYVFSAPLCTEDPNREYGVGRPLVAHLTRDQIVSMARSITDPAQRDIRIFGKITGRAGLILPYDHNVHLIEPFSIPDFWPVWAGCDPGVRGFAVSFQTVTPDDQTIVWGEYFARRQSSNTNTSSMNEIFQKLKRPLDDNLLVFVDTAEQQEIIELNERFYEKSLPMTALSLDMGRKAIKAGIDRLHYMMTPDDELEYPDRTPSHRGIYGSPRLIGRAHV